MREAIVRSGRTPYEQNIEIGSHALVADAPLDHHGGDLGPEPHELLCAALASCTSITLQMYAARKRWHLTRVEVRVSIEKVSDLHLLRRRIRLDGNLDASQRERLLDIAGKCPVHATLTGNISIESALDEP